MVPPSITASASQLHPTGHWPDSSNLGPFGLESNLGLRGCLDLGRYSLEEDIPPFSWLPSSSIFCAQHPPVSGRAQVPLSTLCAALYLCARTLPSGLTASWGWVPACFLFCPW